MNKLIYFTLSNNINYIKLAELCVKSLYQHNYDGDFLFITNFENEILNSIEFVKSPYFLKIGNNSLFESSSNKLKIYNFEKVYEFDKIIFSDLDILWLKNPDIIFKMIETDEFYISIENSLMSDEWWGLKILNQDEKQDIIKNQINGLNAGLYGFNNRMIKHFKKIDQFLTENKHLSNECLEQPFLNVYLYRNKLYNTNISRYVSHNGYNLNEFDGVVLHFAGGPGNFNGKYEKMKNFKIKK